ncbi:fatty acid elongation protein, GNS1/SUR4 family, putative [Plasmodium sp. gorilla clade G3]|nr:fatty acid elongation protein, GNS1/SUR4 family, putative [Plasmodium sp. gorilla clade G3]
MITNIITKTNDEYSMEIIGHIRNYPKRPIFFIEEIYPFLNYVSFKWERDFKPFHFIQFVHNKYFICPLIVIIYLLFCKYGNILMRDKKALNLKRTISIWNFVLSFFNLLVTIKLYPVLIYIIYHYSLTGLLIIPPIYTCGFGTVGLWICFFIISKYFELIDTLFLILKKKEITFLHWFHHSTVLLYTWDTYYEEIPVGFIFICINAFVHSIMYFYYFLASCYNKKFKWSIIVTFIQICQMFLGVLLTSYCLYISYIYTYNNKWTVSFVHKLKNNVTFQYGHYISRKNIILASLMYISYLYLFINYFFHRYTISYLIKKKKKT